MCRNTPYYKINIAYGNRKNEFSSDIFGRNFKLRNCWLNSKLCAMRKLSHSDIKEILKFVIELQN